MSGQNYFDHTRRIWCDPSGAPLPGQYTDVSPLTPAPQASRGQQQQPSRQPQQQRRNTSSPPRQQTSAPPGRDPAGWDPFGVYRNRPTNHGFQFGTAPTSQAAPPRQSSPPRRQLQDTHMTAGQRNAAALQAARDATAQRELREREAADAATAALREQQARDAAAAARRTPPFSFEQFRHQYRGASGGRGQ
jgi:hypothetical protein